MGIKRKPYYNDSQLKRVIVQVMSAFCGYQVRTGKQRDGQHRFLDVPVMYADYSRTAATIMNGGAEGSMASLPIISVELTRLKQSDEYRRAPQHVETYMWRERARKPGSEEAGSDPGKRMIMERHMPVPYDMGIKLAIWASNADQAFQLCEQIATQFNPEVDLQLSNSPGDWTFLTTLKFDGEIRPTRRAADIGGGTEDAYHVYEMDFNCIIQLSPPAIVYESRLIQEVHVNIQYMNESIDWDSMTDIDGFVIRADTDPD
jgi:hypothetical protein